MTRLSVLNSMAGRDFEDALDRIGGLGLHEVDLKDSIFGKEILDLSDDELEMAERKLLERGLTVHCLSSTLFHHLVQDGVGQCKRDALALDRLLVLADLFRPRFVRILAPRIAGREHVQDSIDYLRRHHRWVLALLNESVTRIAQAGHTATIENERGDCALGCPREVLGLFDVLDRPDAIVFTWDVQNMWEAGCFPTVAGYEELRPVIGYYHVKGGRHDGQSNKLRWRSSLEDASWPVAEITRRVISDGRSPVICLNPPHGEPSPAGDDADLLHRDLAYLRSLIDGAERGSE